MSLTKDEIKAWVDAPGRGREWLAQQCSTADKPTAIGTVNNWLTVKSVNIPSRALLIIEKLMRESELRNPTTPLPERISIEAERDEFRAWDRASRAAAADSLEDWIVKALNHAAEISTNETKISPFPIKANIHAAAGSPINAEVADWNLSDDTIMVAINGLSMDPVLADGQVVPMKLKKAARNPFMKKGLIYLVEYDGGYTVKRYNTRKVNEDELAEDGSDEWIEKGKVKVLESVNPDYPEIVIKQPVEWVAWLDEKAGK